MKALIDSFIEYSYYVLKIKTKHELYIKIGEAKKTRLNKRIADLKKQYEDSRNLGVIVEVLATGDLPHNTIKGLRDSKLREEVSKYLRSADYRIVEHEVGAKDGSTEFLEVGNKTDDDIINIISQAIEILSKNSSNFTRKVTYTNLALRYNADQKHLVRYQIIKAIEKMAGECIAYVENKNILLIGQFAHDWIATFALRNNVYIMHDSTEQIHDYEYDLIDEHLHYITEFKELIELDMDFDIIVSNPPYKQGNVITRNIIDNIQFDTFINLMPLKYYKSGKLYEHVSSFEVIDPTAFTDAVITENLNIAKLNKDPAENTWEIFELESFDPKFKKFYEKNLQLTHYAIDAAPMGSNGKPENIIDRSKNIKAAFAIPTRTVFAGVNKTTQCFDFKWNIQKILDFEDIHIAPQGGCTVAFIYFNTELEHTNFSAYWYRRELSHKLIKGLNKRSGSPRIAIPRIDWSRNDVEYTDEYVLEQMGLKWNADKDGVEEI